MTDYSKTINLPATKFSMKANLSQTEMSWIDFWQDKKIIEKKKKITEKASKFILHDGPPYANGDLHLGHALNKILKDIVCRFRYQKGEAVHYVPGWDCHGLPIEWKVEEKFRKSGKEKEEVDLIEFREECRKFAGNWVDKQKSQFSRFGLSTDWKEIYLTMNKDVEVTIVSELINFLESEQLYLGFKPVMWSVVEQTALAEAEIEYKEKTSKAIYVKFPVVGEDKSIVIWTTTPWTIPCNRAIAYSNKLNYKILEVKDNSDNTNFKVGEEILICEDLIEDFVQKTKIKEFNIKSDVCSEEIEKIECSHPLKKGGYEDLVKVFPSSHVTSESGTGFVHIAPNHGVEDFEVGEKFNIQNQPSVSEKGLYTENIKLFKNQHIYKSDDLVIEKLKEYKTLLGIEEYIHSYPHSWRSKAPLIYRATSQWFISMEKKELRKKAIEEIEKVQWIPSGSKKRIMSMIKDRPDWCVSRQRMWGVPITIFVSKKTGKPLIDKNVNNKILNVLKENGVESWFELPNETFLTDGYLPDEYHKVSSILDVWFDSGSSHVYVLKNNKIKDKADLYLEGSDQHRGWFQTSLLESCANYGESPFKAVLTHGFVIDENGRKMSKSLGNVISPSDIINKYGADILRIWVANSNTNEDVKISFENLARQSENYRKIRNTIRFILGNMRGWNKKEIDYDDFESLEKFICHRLFKLNNEINLLYENYNFNKIFQLVLSFCSQELSTLFFDIRKDTLYCEKRDSLKVNQTKTVLNYVFNCLIRWISPIIPFTSEEAWQSWKNEIDDGTIESCHLLQAEALPNIWEQEELEFLWEKILSVKDLFSLCVEKKRNSKEIKSGLEAKVLIHLGSNYEVIKDKVDLSEILISSNVEHVENIDESFESDHDKNFFIKIESVSGNKCPRCWKYFNMEVKSILCNRCKKVLDE